MLESDDGISKCTAADRFVKAVKSVAVKRLTHQQLTDNGGPGGRAAQSMPEFFPGLT